MRENQTIANPTNRQIKHEHTSDDDDENNEISGSEGS